MGATSPGGFPGAAKSPRSPAMSWLTWQRPPQLFSNCMSTERMHFATRVHCSGYDIGCSADRPGVVADGTGVVVLDAGPGSSLKGGRKSTFVREAGLTCGDRVMAPDGYDPPSLVCAEVELAPMLKVMIAIRSNRIAMPVRKWRPSFAGGSGPPNVRATSTSAHSC